MKNARTPTTGTSALDKRNYSQVDDLFPESFRSKRLEADRAAATRPIVSGQCAQVLELIRAQGPILSFVMTADHAIPEAAAQVHDLRAAGFNIVTRIVPEVEFRGAIRRKAAMYSMGIPEWPAPGFFGAGA